MSRQLAVRLNLVKRVHAISRPPKTFSVQQKNIPRSEHQELNEALEKIKDVSTINFIKSNEQLFKGTGQFPDQVKLMIDPKVEPTRYPPRRVPLVIESKVKDYLQQLAAQEIVSPVEEPRSWVSHMLIREKPNGSIRVCLDPKDLNQAIKRNYYQIPSVEHIQSQLAGNEYFTVVDLKDGFWHCVLDPASSEVCTFSTPMGCFKFNRLPFGLNASPEIFQARCEYYFGDIVGVTNFFDDMIIWGKNEEEHNTALTKFVQRAIIPTRYN